MQDQRGFLGEEGTKGQGEIVSISESGGGRSRLGRVRGGVEAGQEDTACCWCHQARIWAVKGADLTTPSLSAEIPPHCHVSGEDVGKASESVLKAGLASFPVVRGQGQRPGGAARLSPAARSPAARPGADRPREPPSSRRIAAGAALRAACPAAAPAVPVGTAAAGSHRHSTGTAPAPRRAASAARERAGRAPGEARRGRWGAAGN